MSVKKARSSSVQRNEKNRPKCSSSRKLVILFILSSCCCFRAGDIVSAVYSIVLLKGSSHSCETRASKSPEKTSKYFHIEEEKTEKEQATKMA